MYSAVPGVVAVGFENNISLPAVQNPVLFVAGTTILAGSSGEISLIPEVDNIPLYVAGTTVMALAGDTPELVPEVDNMPLYVAGTAVVGRPSSGDKLDVYGNVKIRGGVIEDAGGIERIALNEPGPTELKADDGSVGLMLTAPEVMVGFRSDPCDPIPVLKVGSDGSVDIGLTDPCLSAIPQPIPIMRASPDGSVDIGVALVSAIPDPIPMPIMRIDTEGNVGIGIADPCNSETGVITVGSDGSASMGSDPCNHVPIITVDSAGNVDIGVDLVSFTPIPLPIPIMEINTDGSVGIGIADPCDPAPRVITIGTDGSVGIGADSSDPDASIITVSAEGKVGIGVTDPTYTLHMLNDNGAYIESTAYAARFNATATTGKAVYAEASSASGTNYAVHGKTNSSDGYAGYFEGNGHFSGNVGIGTSNSAARKLHVSDVMRLEPRASAPSSPSEGDIYYDSTLHQLMVYNGTMWKACF
jgi:hypothetical protein